MDTVDITTTGTGNYVYTIPPTKEQIIKRLFDSGLITIDEVITLAKDTIINIPPTVTTYPPYAPFGVNPNPIWVVSEGSGTANFNAPNTFTSTT